MMIAGNSAPRIAAAPSPSPDTNAIVHNQRRSPLSLHFSVISHSDAAIKAVKGCGSAWMAVFQTFCENANDRAAANATNGNTR